MTDMTPDLLQAINAQFDEQAAQSAVIKQEIKKLRSGDATFIDANRLAIEVGNLLSQALQQNISSAVLPDGKLYYNMANRLLNSTLQKKFEIIAGYSTDVQKLLNQQARIGIKAQQPTINQDRIDGFVNRLASEDHFDDVQWLLNEPVINFSQHIVDDTIDTNVKLHAKAGLHPKITRTVAGKACKWCANLAGSYEYPNDVPHDIYHRHERCRCMVNYLPRDGKRQNIWSKKWVDPQKNAKLEARKQIGLKSPLSFPEKQALQQYISSDAYKLNDMLRRDAVLSDQYRRMVKHLDSGLDKLPKYADTNPLYRSLTFQGRADTYRFVQQMIKDGQYVDKGYVSASKEVYAAEDSARMVIKKSHSGADLKGINDAEKEVLFKRGTLFKVNDYYLDKSGKPIIEVTEHD